MTAILQAITAASKRLGLDPRTPSAAAADEIVKLRSCARREKRDRAELRPEELRIRAKFGLLEDTPLHDVTRRGSPLL